MSQDPRFLVLGAGPAGLGATNEWAAAGHRPRLLERDDAMGGLCRTIEFKGFLFDIGGHRFLTPYDEVQRIWTEVMGDDMLRVRRQSRIFYRQRFFNYPLSAANAARNLGWTESLRCIGSFLAAHVAPQPGPSFEDWMTRRFGRRLFDIFFKSYTEKLWGLPCRRLSSDWADQRIENMSLGVALRRALLGQTGPTPKTLTDTFLYPRTGPGEFYRRYLARAVAAGAEAWPGHSVERIHHQNGRVVSVTTRRPQDGSMHEHPAESVLSTLPLPTLIEALEPPAPPRVVEAARRLRFRNYLVVNVILNREHLFPDQWIYVQSHEVRLARLQNYKNWSAAMVPDPRKTSLGLEYFASSDDDFWDLPDSELIAWALSDLEHIGLGSRNDLIDAFVVRQKNAYPIYELGYRKHLDIVRTYLDGLTNLRCAGRAGLFRYCNSDLALLTGLLAARQLLGRTDENPWNL